jgi:hypothetical protein
MKTINTDKYFYHTGYTSPLSAIFNNVDSFTWVEGPDVDQEQCLLDQSLIYQDKFLTKLHIESNFGGALSILRLPPNNMYNWHVDTRQVCNINLINSTTDKYTFFKLDPSEHPHSNANPLYNKIKDLIPIIQSNAIANQWTVLNSTILHAGINFSNDPKYMIQYAIKKESYKNPFIDVASSKLKYQDVVNIAKSMETLQVK